MISLLASRARLRSFPPCCNKESDVHLMRQCQPSVYKTDCCCAETWQYVCRAPWLHKVKKYEQKMWTPQTHTVQTCATNEFYGNTVFFFKCLEVLLFLCLTFSLHLPGLGNPRFRGCKGVLCFSGCTQHRRDPCYDADVYLFWFSMVEDRKCHFPCGKIWHSYKAISRTTTSSVFRWNFQL